MSIREEDLSRDPNGTIKIQEMMNECARESEQAVRLTDSPIFAWMTDSEYGSTYREGGRGM